MYLRMFKTRNLLLFPNERRVIILYLHYRHPDGYIHAINSSYRHISNNLLQKKKYIQYI